MSKDSFTCKLVDHVFDDVGIICWTMSEGISCPVNSIDQPRPFDKNSIIDAITVQPKGHEVPQAIAGMTIEQANKILSSLNGNCASCIMLNAILSKLAGATK